MPRFTSDLFLGYLFIAFFLLSLPAHANFDFNSNCVKAYDNIMCLRLNTARQIIATEKKANPKNAIPFLLDNYVDYFTLLTTENIQEFDRLKNNKSLRLERMEAEDKNSPYYLYSQAEINLQWALIRGRFQEYFTASLEINRAYKQLQANSKKFPSFLPGQKGLGMINALLGSLPDGLKRTLGTLGIRGNTQTGIKMLENLVSVLPGSSYAYYYDEVVFYLAYIRIDIANDSSAYKQIIQNTQLIDTSSLLRNYIRGYAGMKTAHNLQAISTLSNRPSGNVYQPYPYLDYLLGIANMHRLDQSASACLLNYLRSYHGINFIKDTYLNLSWLSLINGDEQGYQNYTALVKSKGYTYHEKDKQALNEANDSAPNIDLLKARLLFDGGYYDKALDIIGNKKSDSFKLGRDKIEYCYRLGRIYDELGRDDFALKFYQFAINLGRNTKYYFSANAALRMGNIYESRKNYEQARTFYNAAIDMKNHDYESSIESKAKEGLKRTGN